MKKNRYSNWIEILLVLNYLLGHFVQGDVIRNAIYHSVLIYLFFRAHDFHSTGDLSRRRTILRITIKYQKQTKR